MDDRTTVDCLTREVELIVSSRYPASLSNLENVLTRVPVSLLQGWARDNPCHLQSLAVTLLESLGDRERATDVLTSLLPSTEFRTVILKHDSSLLTYFIEKALGTSDEKYTTASLLCLQSPLPTGVCLPAVAEQFLRHLCARANDDGDLTSIRMLSDLLDGACAPLLATLPPTELAALEHELKARLREGKRDAPQLPKLYGVKILSQFARFKVESQRSRAEEIEEGKKFLTSGSAKKVDMINSTIITFCKPESAEQAVSVVRLSNDLLDILGDQALLEWRQTLTATGIAATTSVQVFRKLKERATSAEIDLQLKREMLAYLARLVGGLGLFANMTDMALATMQNCLEGPCESYDWLHRIVQVLASSHPQIDLKVLIQQLIRDTTEVKTAASLEKVSTVSQLLTRALGDSQVLCNAIVSAFCSDELNVHLRSLRTSISSASSHSTAPVGICLSALEERRRAAVLALDALWSLAVAGTCSSDDAELATRRSISSAFIELRQYTSQPRTMCDHSRLKPRSDHHRSILEQACTQAPTRRDDWREKINEAIEDYHDIKKQNIIQVFLQHCSDLERRCADVETPLMKERETVAQMRQTCETLQSKTDQMAVEAEESNAHIADLELELRSRNQHIQQQATNLEAATCRIQSLITDMQEVEAESKRAMEAQISAHDQETMTLRSDLEAKIEDINEKTTENEKLTETMRHKVAENQQLQTDIEASHASASALQTRLHESEEEISAAARSAELARQEQERLEELLRGTQAEIDKVREDAKQIKVKLQKAEEALSADVNASREALSRMQTKYTEDVERRDGDIRQLRETLRAQHSKAESAIMHYRQERDELDEQVKSHLADLRDLQDEVQEKDAELQKWREWHSMAAPTTTRRRPKTEGAIDGRRQTKRSSRLISGKALAHEDLALPNESHQDASTFSAAEDHEASQQEGSTPKRARSHMPFKPPRATATKLNVRRSIRRSSVRQQPIASDDEDPAVPESALVTGAAVAKSERRPLADVSTGRGNATVAPATTCDGKDLKVRAVKGTTPRATLPAFSSFDFEGCDSSTPRPTRREPELLEVTEMTMDASDTE